MRCCFLPCANSVISTVVLFFIGLISFSAISSESATEPTESVSAPLPYTVFSSLPAYRTPALSPKGDKIAFVKNINEPDELSVFATYDLTTHKMHYLIHSDNEKVKINWYRWVNNERLVLSARYESRRGNTRVYDTRLLAMDYDAQGESPLTVLDWRRLKRRAADPSRVPQFQDNVVDWLPDDPDHILMSVDVETFALPSVYKVNINNGKTSRIERGKRSIREWIIDRQHNVRIGITLDYESGERHVLLKKEEGGWRTLFSYNAMNEKGEEPIGFGLDPNILYYRGYKGDYKALYTLDLTTNESTEILADEGYDVNGSLIYSAMTNDAIGIRHDGRHYWDERYVALQNGLDEALVDYDNTLVSFSRDEKTYIVYSESDTMPGAYFIGNRDKGSLDFLFEQYPQIEEGMLTEHELVSYTARDDTKIEAYLTLPKGEGPFPTIIHPHGGPGARDFSGFDYWTSYFTNKGYAVLRPNFRGSQGYGFDFAQSQMKSWGLSMQDDITDAAKWMVEQGYSTEDNMCIVGASYGGYAALMATVKTPELFQCAVSFAGVSSLKHIVIHARRFVNSDLVKEQIGDDFDDLKARSPYYNAKGITTPILMLHGEEDRVVRPMQSRYMADELDDLDKTFKYVELDSGDHYLSIQGNRHRFFAEMDAFLDKYLKTE
ncbi:prolyl oligopeptidase family serine peptidase [Alteromonas sp. 1_MG-2023]|uniref:alpha/beta hydrolase family protein n=1 Tax=Alteromonas sp. 1_MG-2023 TaxID=3062669 RepID=UPI0026E23EC3|nr:prolyl oligopeptidase family serine peptidase [Alteromonas sp. 1_MG-2023]MDO6566815.1 prolyl oligopeptidase family serine peptidase [Alteromonas sp. 1_MG-2023]